MLKVELGTNLHLMTLCTLVIFSVKPIACQGEYLLLIWA